MSKLSIKSINKPDMVPTAWTPVFPVPRKARFILITVNYYLEGKLLDFLFAALK
jgi:hypothetical protein